MAKPDWKEAPEWAQWLGFDSTGGAYWHEWKPKLYGAEWYGRGRTKYAGRSFSVSPRVEPRP